MNRGGLVAAMYAITGGLAVAGGLACSGHRTQAAAAAAQAPPHEQVCAVPHGAPLEIAPNERLLVFAPHPDDESLGAGGLVEAVLAKGGSVRIVTLTAGDGYPEALAATLGILRPTRADFLAFGERRIGELHSAARALGAETVRVDVLGFPDGALARVLEEPDERPIASPTTGASAVPYADAFAPETPHTARALADLLARVLRETQPTLVAVPDPHDEHPDHAATGRAALAAVAAESRARQREPLRTRTLAYLVHWGPHPADWQTDRTAAETAALPLCLPTGFPREARREFVLDLRPEWIAGKARAIAAHRSQRPMMARYLDSFARANEVFVLVPSVD